MRSLLLVSFLGMVLTWSGSLFALETRSFDEFCDLTTFIAPLRQTIVVIDGHMIKPETGEGINPGNRPWREFVANLLNPEDPSVQQRFAPRERVTLAIAVGDGSGTKNIFTGCLPTYSKDEQDNLGKGDTAWGTFLGGGLKAKLSEGADSFRQAMLLSLAEGARTTAPIDGAVKPFARGALISSLGRGLGISQEYGIPRVVIYSDLSLYETPTGNTEASRKQARDDAESAGVDLMSSEVHIIGLRGGEKSANGEYIKAFFLASKGKVETLTGIDGSIKATNSPVTVSVFQGQIKYMDGPSTMRIRLAVDRNGTAVNSWAEVISDSRRFTPFGGVLTCKNEKDCDFGGDQIFAQIWSDNPNPEPDFAAWMPFGGMRDFAFKLIDNQMIKGRISDRTGYVPGLEDGLPFELSIVKNGLYN